VTAPPGNRDAALLGILNRCRTRAGFVVFVQASATACALTLTVASVTRLIWSADSNVVIWMSAAVAVGIGCGAALTLLRYPSSREVARDIDRHLRLEDTVIAALQLRDSGAPVGPLVLRQALDRVGNVDAASLFPMELRRPAAMLAAALLVVLATLPRSDGRPLVSREGRSVSTSDAGGGEAAGTGRAPTNITAQPALRNSATKAGENATPSAEQRPSEAPGSDPPAASSQPGAGGRGTARAADSGREAPALAQTSGGADARGGAGSAASGPARGTGAGGVRGGTLIPSATAATETTPADPPPSRYQQAQRSAEAALTRGAIPPELRSYVREYFRAISR
jgi:hypothetical protein